MFEGKVHLLAGFYLRSEHILQSAFGAGFFLADIIVHGVQSAPPVASEYL